ncbi:methyltransferase 23 isoform X1 [Labeo rohita]|uniref:Methyltransferase 23 isoform X1 n=1 Tax=Labeo rohita TaxID=84645 RepID=A0A498LMU8_LABRO|nr:methyltransferase 23 isoform X1 [Labeo rohita]RXN29446.1 methyltransferase 23 isoform X1 [Labeo rohita]
MNESFQTLVEKSFRFEDCGGSQSLTVSIPEVLDPQYGMYVWPCAVVLSQYVWMTRSELQHKTVLELGAGVSLPGVVAAKCEAHVILSDSAELPLCLRNCRRSCEVNNLPNVPVIGLTWGQAGRRLSVVSYTYLSTTKTPICFKATPTGAGSWITYTSTSSNCTTQPCFYIAILDSAAWRKQFHIEFNSIVKAEPKPAVQVNF